jgi:hypothetical protein
MEMWLVVGGDGFGDGMVWVVVVVGVVMVVCMGWMIVVGW